MRHIILLCGRRGQGKDECANYLIQKHGYYRLAFADRLKNEVARQYFLPRYALDSVHLKERYRPLLQQYGTEKRQLYGNNVWVNNILKDIEMLMPNQNVVITDWRFMNELDVIKLSNHKITTARVTAINKPNPIFTLDEASQNKVDHHISETELDSVPVDYEIQNEWNNREHTFVALDSICTSKNHDV